MTDMHGTRRTISWVTFLGRNPSELVAVRSSGVSLPKIRRLGLDSDRVTRGRLAVSDPSEENNDDRECHDDIDCFTHSERWRIRGVCA